MHRLVQLALVFCLTTTGIFFLRVSSVVPDETRASSQAVQRSLTRLDSAVADLDRVTLVAGGVLNEARQIERDNRKQLSQVNTRTLFTLEHVDDLVMNLDASQKQAAASIQQTSQALVPVIQQTAQDVHDLDPAIQQLLPLLQQVTATTQNINQTTADMAFEVHKFIHPPPRKWWQRYLTDPLRLGLHLVTVPVTHM